MSEPKKIQKIHQFSRKLTICEKKSPFDLKKTLSNSFKISRHSLFFLEKFFPEANRSDWNNWEWQIRNSITSLEQLKNIISLTDDEINYISQHKDYLPLRITPYYASLLDRYNAEHALRKTVIPASAENIKSIGEAEDPLSEDEQSPVPGLVHRYPDRVLFLTTGFCSTNCRYCTRSRVVSGHTNYCFDTSQWQAALSYIEKTKSIRDVLLSGGEVLTLSDENLEYLLLRLKKIKHIEIVRLGTKVPAVLPQRITRELVKMLKKYHPLWMNIHFTHPDEITPEVAEACSRLSDAGIPLGSQTVLLKNINDSVDTIKKLYHELLKIRVRPYYLYQCDPIIGSGHFRTSIEKGLEIIKGLRGFTTGFAVPHYVIDAPGGGGKTPILPEYYIGRENNEVILRNFEGNIYRYPDYNG
ncbi:KamA family radical SAM protein [Candidatus Dependentiae bacterium]|nr:KamA family radical SAM protein [Candidatus Dependentiae bacterium]